MSNVGKVESLWRYPVKGLRGEELDEAFVGFSGIYGDRIFAFSSAKSPKGFPYFTGREKEEILRYTPRFRNKTSAARPINLDDAKSLAPGVTPLYADPADLLVDVETPTGEVFAIDDPALIAILAKDVDPGHEVSLLRSERALTDCRPLSLFSIQTAKTLGDELGTDVDKRRFRANIYLDLDSGFGFGEDGFVGKTLRLGKEVTVTVLERDPRCKMITLDPDTAESNPKVLRAVAQSHDNMAGVFGAVLVEGMLKSGDAIELLD